MKIEAAKHNIEISGGNQSSAFSIAMNGKAFKVLSDTMYQNKIGSIVREISCNAYDGHVMAGCTDKPFEIHLPDNFEPWFSVKDFGVGLSPESIKSVFTVYFESTKDQSNDAIGAFGLGAKTPFSYTDQFTVTSIFNGVKSIYSAFIGSSGVPDMRLMTSSETTEGNGVEIKMSARSEDFSRFGAEVKDQLRMFKVKPIIRNNGYFTWNPQETPTLEYAGVELFGNQGYGQKNIYAVQGQIPYLINTSMLESKLSDDARKILQKLSNYRVHMHFNIGQIGVTASREGVEYDNNTVTNIEAKLMEFRKEANKDVIAKAATIATDWELALYLNANNTFISASSFKSNFKTLTVQFDGAGNAGFDLTNLNVQFNETSIARRHDVKMRKCGTIRRIVPGKDYALLVKDTSSLSNIRVRKFFDNNPTISYVYVIAVDSALAKDIAGNITKALGDSDNVHLISSIEIPKEEREKAATRRSSTCEFYTAGNDDVVWNWNREFTYTEDIAEECVYVMVENRDYLNSTERGAASAYFQLKQFTTVPKLIGVRVVNEKHAQANKNLKPLSEYIAKMKAKSAEFSDLRRKYNNVSSYRSLQGNSHVYYAKANAQVFMLTAPDARISKLFELTRRLAGNFANNQSHGAECAAKFYGWQPKVNPRLQRVVDDMQETAMKLPLLDSVIRRGYTSVFEAGHLADYAKHVPH